MYIDLLLDSRVIIGLLTLAEVISSSFGFLSLTILIPDVIFLTAKFIIMQLLLVDFTWLYFSCVILVGHVNLLDLVGCETAKSAAIFDGFPALIDAF